MAPLTPRDILAANVRRLLERDTPPGQKLSLRAWALGKGLDVKLIERITKNSHAVTLEKLTEIADACGVKPWQLLLEDFDPLAAAAPPLSAEDRALLTRLRRMLGDGSTGANPS